LNIVLAEKIRKAYEMGIQIECHVDFTKGSFMTPLDISTIFGNLLDNALKGPITALAEDLAKLRGTLGLN
jgi:sensor histidine kinase regulating citrate/malate metabolism